MTQATIHQAKTNLSKLIQKALDGEEVIIANRDKPLVRLTVIKPVGRKRQMGWAPGVVTYMAPDFNEEVDDFADYMPASGKIPARRRKGRK